MGLNTLQEKSYEHSAEETEFIVEASNAKKVYQSGSIRVEALRGIDLNVKRHEMLAIMGPSGCGKTTLLNCFSGLDDLTEGIVKIDGKNVHKMSDNEKSEFRAKRMGFIFQSYNLLPVLTSVENVALPLLVSGVKESEAKALAVRALEAVDLEKWKSHKPSELSGGQQQRVAIARSIVNKPALIWGDEPTGNLDSENSEEIVNVLRKLNSEIGLTLVLVTHDQAVARRTERIIRMRNGLIEKIVPASVVKEASPPFER
jgi:putative ABC transport system ATP-binding protein